MLKSSLRLCLLALWASPVTLLGQTFSSAPAGHIQDNATTDFSMPVSGLVPSTLDTSTFGLETVCFNLTHTWDSDLHIQIIAPDGTTATLVNSIGGSDDDFANTCLNDSAALPVTAGTAPFTGTWRPQGQMGRVNNGQNGNGTWTLRITDMVGGDDGTLLDWGITFGSDPASYFSFSSSDLPIVKINTLGQQIVDDPKTMASMGIIDNGPGQRNYATDAPNGYNGRIGIELRGSSSQGFPKKPYGFELWDLNGNAIDAPILGMPAESDWILNPSYNDKTLLRNPLAFRLANAMNSQYATRGTHVEVMLNDEYVGVYYLCEKIKRDPGRVDIAKLQYADTLGDDLTGGYILKVDKRTGSSDVYWNSLIQPPFAPPGNYPEIVLHYPNEDDVHPKQVDYIHSFVDSFELALSGPGFADPATGFRRFADARSMADYLLLTEFMRAVDGYRISAFFYKDKDSRGGKLMMGPPWDYDIAYGNGDYCDGWQPAGWAYDFNQVCGQGGGYLVPFWWNRVLEDSTFVQELRCRWETHKIAALDTTRIFAWIDSAATHLDESQRRNFIAWPILGTYVWPNYYIAADYAGEIANLKWFIGARYRWMDANLGGDPAACNLVSAPAPRGLTQLQVWPNPARNAVRVAFDSQPGTAYTLHLRDLQGRLLRQHTGVSLSGRVEETLSLTDLAAGVYLLEVQDGLSRRTIRLVRE
jgi:subtilisin-like proprotein convertase family protein